MTLPLWITSCFGLLSRNPADDVNSPYEPRNFWLTLLFGLIALGAVIGISGLAFFFAYWGVAYWGELACWAVVGIMFVGFWASWGVNAIAPKLKKVGPPDPNSLEEVKLSTLQKIICNFFAYGFGLCISCGGYVGGWAFAQAYAEAKGIAFVYFQIGGIITSGCMAVILGFFMLHFLTYTFKKWEHDKKEDERDWNALKPHLEALKNIWSVAFVNPVEFRNALGLSEAQFINYSGAMTFIINRYVTYQIAVRRKESEGSIYNESCWHVLGLDIARLTEKTKRYMNEQWAAGHSLVRWKEFAKPLAAIDKLYNQKFKLYESIAAQESAYPQHTVTYKHEIRRRVEKIKNRVMGWKWQIFGIAVAILTGAGLGAFKYTSTEEFLTLVGLSQGITFYSLLWIAVSVMTIATWLTSSPILYDKLKSWRESVNANDPPAEIKPDTISPTHRAVVTFFVESFAFLNGAGPVVSLCIQFAFPSLAFGAQIALLTTSILFMGIIRYAENRYTNGEGFVGKALEQPWTLIGFAPKFVPPPEEPEFKHFLHRTFPVLALPVLSPFEGVRENASKKEIKQFLSDRIHALAPKQPALKLPIFDSSLPERPQPIAVPRV